MESSPERDDRILNCRYQVGENIQLDIGLVDPGGDKRRQPHFCQLIDLFRCQTGRCEFGTGACRAAFHRPDELDNENLTFFFEFA